MSDVPAPELSRIVRLDEIGRMSGQQHISASAEECAALARRFAYVAIERLEADYAIVPQGKALLATGRLRAALTQRCIATGEPVTETIDAPFAIRFLREEDEIAPGDEMELDADEVDTVSFSGESIDMGEAVAETLALSVDPYPRRPDADEWLRKMGVMNEEQASPFAMLAKLKAR